MVISSFELKFNLFWRSFIRNLVFGEITIFVIISEKSFIKLTGNEMTRLWGWGRVASWAGAGASLVVLQSKGNPGVAIKPDCPSTSGKKFQTETFHGKKSG